MGVVEPDLFKSLLSATVIRGETCFCQKMRMDRKTGLKLACSLAINPAIGVSSA